MPMPGPKPTPILLPPPQQTLLRRIIQRHTAPQRLVRRARIILAASEGLNNAQIARKLDLGLKAVKRWRARWLEALPKLEAAQADEAHLAHCIAETLADEPRPGAPPVFSAEQVAQIFALACQEPAQTGRPVTHWTEADLANEAVKQGIVETISPRTVGRFLKRSRDQTSPEPLLAQSRD